MTGFLVRMSITAVGLWAAAYLVDGIDIHSTGTLLWAAVWLGIVNAVVRPVAVFLTFPFTLVTLGLFLWVINAAMIGLVAWLLDGVFVDGFLPALFGAIIVSFTGWLGNAFIGEKGRYEIVEKRD